MPPDDGACARPIDVDIARFNLRFGALDICRAARKKSGCKRVIGAVRNIERLIEIAHLNDAEHRAEDFFARDSHVWLHAGENCRRDEITFRWHLLSLIGENCLAFANLDVFENAFVRGLVNHRANHHPWFFRIADPQTGRSRK